MKKITLRQLNTQLISERARPPTGRPGQRGHEGSFLHKAAIMKHIHPYCNSSIEAILISTERDRKYETEVNLVFKIHPNEFIEAGDYRETVKKMCNFLLLLKDVLSRFTNQNTPVSTGNVRKIKVEYLR